MYDIFCFSFSFSLFLALICAYLVVMGMLYDVCM